MAARIDKDAAEAKSRVLLVVLTALTLRLMEHWHSALAKVFDKQPDYDMTMIMAAVISINADKFVRMDLEPALETLAHPLPYDLLSDCNVSSIAAATALNRETVRRKVNSLIAAGLLFKEGRSIHIARGLLQRPLARETIDSQLNALTRAVNQLERLLVLRPD